MDNQPTLETQDTKDTERRQNKPPQDNTEN